MGLLLLRLLRAEVDSAPTQFLPHTSVKTQHHYSGDREMPAVGKGWVGMSVTVVSPYALHVANPDTVIGTKIGILSTYGAIL
ncbi:UNVERIFIED_CONTAM: hypothetical protein K2H54_000870 [Gekko kuhli]